MLHVPLTALTDFLPLYQEGFQKRDVTNLPEELQSLPQAWQISLMIDIAEKTGWLDLSNLRLTDQHLELLLPRLNLIPNLSEINLCGNLLTLPEYIGILKLTPITSTETQTLDSSKTQHSSNANEDEDEISDSSSTVYDPDCFNDDSDNAEEFLDVNSSLGTISREIDIPNHRVTSALRQEGFFAFPPYPKSETSSASDDEQEANTSESDDELWTTIPFPMNGINTF